jgi:Transposase IS200 like
LALRSREERLREREIFKQVCSELGVTIINGVLSSDHVHIFVEIAPHVLVSDFVRRTKGRPSRKIQQEFEHIRKRYWGQRLWGNPIEQVFAKLKHLMRKAAERAHETTWKRIGSPLDNFPPHECNADLKNSGYGAA